MITQVKTVISEDHIDTFKTLSEASVPYSNQHSDTYNYYIFSFVLVGAKETKYHKDEIEEVGNDGQPHVTQEVKHLSLCC